MIDKQTSSPELVKLQEKLNRRIQFFRTIDIDEEHSSMTFQLIAEKLNGLLATITFAVTPKEYNDHLITIRNFYNTIRTLRTTNELSRDEERELLKTIKKIEIVAKEGFRSVGIKKNRKGQYKLPEETIKGKLKNLIMGENKWASAGAFAGFITDSPALMLAGQWLSDKATAKREKREEEIENQQELLIKIAKVKLEEKLERQEKQLEYFNDGLEKKVEKESDKLDKQAKQRKKIIEQISKRKKDELDNQLEKVLKDLKVYNESEIETIIDNMRLELKDDEIAKQVIDIEKNGAEKFKEFVDKYNKKVAPKIKEIPLQLSNELEKMVGGIDIGGVAEEIGIPPESLIPVQNELISRIRKEDVYTPLLQEQPPEGMVEGNLGDIYDLIGDVKDILKEQLPEINKSLSIFNKNWIMVNDKEMWRDRDRWLESIAMSTYEEPTVQKQKKEGGIIDKLLGKKEDGKIGLNKGFDLLKMGGGLMGGLKDLFLKGKGLISKIPLAGIGGGMALAAPPALFIMGMNEGWKEQQKVEDQQIKTIVDNVQRIKKKKEKYQKWNDFKEKIKMPRDQEQALLDATIKGRESEFPTRSDKIEFLTSQIQKGQWGEKLQYQWSAHSKGENDLTFPATATTTSKNEITPVQQPNKIMEIPKTSNLPDIKKKDTTVAETPNKIIPPTNDIPFNLQPGVSIEGINKNVKTHLIQLGQEYKEMTGKKALITSGFRTNAQQKKLYENYIKDPDNNPQAAPPGLSRHESGMAVDIDSKDTNKMAQLGLLEKHGFKRPYLYSKKPEPWHIEPVQSNIGDPIASNDSIDLRKTIEKYNTINNISKTNTKNDNKNNTFAMNQNNTNVIYKPRDLRHFIDDPGLRQNNWNGVV